MLRKRLYTFLVIGTILFLGGIALWKTSEKTLEGLTIVTGPVEIVKMTKAHNVRVSNQSTFTIVYFTIAGVQDKFALSDNLQSRLDSYLQQIKVGDTLKVYYDEHMNLTDDGYNVYVYQVEHHGVRIVDLATANSDNKLVGIVFLVVSSIMLIGSIGYYFSPRNRLLRHPADPSQG